MALTLSNWLRCDSGLIGATKELGKQRKALRRLYAWQSLLLPPQQQGQGILRGYDRCRSEIK